MAQWMISSSLLILFVILVRAAFGRKISLRFRYSLWELVLLRLMIPVSPVKSDLSVMNLFRHETKMLLREVLLSEIVSEEAEAVALSVMDTAAISQRVDVLLLIWLAVAFLLFFRQIRGTLLFRRKLKKAERFTAVSSAIPVYVLRELPSPCLFGFLRPAVYLNGTVCENPEYRDHAVAHELCHYRHLDHVWAVMREMVLCVFWFHPFVWLAVYFSRIDCELACDEAVLRGMNSEEQCIAYGKTLLALSAVQNHLRIPGDASPMTHTCSMMKERIHMIVNRPKHKAAAVLLAVLVMTFAVGSTFTSAADVKESVSAAPEQEYVTETPDVAEENKEPVVVVIPRQEETLIFCWPVETPHERMLTALYSTERHCGIDMSWNGCSGEDVLAACDGTVVTAVEGASQHKHGNYLVIDHGNGVSTLYAHMSELSVKEGDEIKAGSVIGKIGSTGLSTGPHLHFEVIRDGENVDPMSVLPALESSEKPVYYQAKALDEVVAAVVRQEMEQQYYQAFPLEKYERTALYYRHDCSENNCHHE